MGDGQTTLDEAQRSLEQRRTKLPKLDRAPAKPPWMQASAALPAPPQRSPEDIEREDRERTEREAAQWDDRAPDRANWLLKRASVGRRLRELLIDREKLPPQVDEWARLAPVGGSLVLAGPPGSGKTVAAVAALRMHIERYLTPERWAKRQILRGPAQQGYWLTYAKAGELYSAVFGRRTDELELARWADVLVVDDLGSGYEHDWPIAELEQIIDRRHEDLLPTIVTTNISPDDGERSLRARLPRSFDRLAGKPGPGVVIMDRPSMRRIGA